MIVSRFIPGPDDTTHYKWSESAGNASVSFMKKFAKTLIVSTTQEIARLVSSSDAAQPPVGSDVSNATSIEDFRASKIERSTSEFQEEAAQCGSSPQGSCI